MKASEEAIKESVVEALGTVLDPCGLYNGSMTTIGDLGMYRDIFVTDDKVLIEVFLDDPACAFSGQILHHIHRALDPIGAVREVEMTMVTDDYWDTDRITPLGQKKLEENRKTSLRLIPLSVAKANQ